MRTSILILKNLPVGFPPAGESFVPGAARVIIWGDAEDSVRLLRRAAEKAFCPVETYGFDGPNDWVASDVVIDGETMRFRVARREKQFGEFTLTATGRHNVLNALAALIVAQGRGIPEREIAKALATFRSVKRRMDVRGEIGGVLVVDDFAHHPTAVKATIEAARGRWPGRRLWAILEPRSNSMRRKVFQDALPKALALGDRVILGGVFRATAIGRRRIVWIRRLLRKVSAPSARMLACFPVPMPSQSISGPRRSRAISF